MSCVHIVCIEHVFPHGNSTYSGYMEICWAEDVRTHAMPDEHIRIMSDYVSRRHVRACVRSKYQAVYLPSECVRTLARWRLEMPDVISESISQHAHQNGRWNCQRTCQRILLYISEKVPWFMMSSFIMTHANQHSRTCVSGWNAQWVANIFWLALNQEEPSD